VKAEPTPRRIIALQPLGPQIDDAQVTLVQTALSAFYDYEIQMLPRVALPKHAFYSPRQRYRAEKLLRNLQPRKPPNAERILALTSVDISTTKGKIHDWGILGLASIDGSVCIISSFRTKRQAKSARHAAERFAKTAVHEIGHTMGLEHCPNHGCLMQDGKGSVFTTDGEYALCPSCRGQLTTRGFPLVTSGSISMPWPKPS
jgi:archaemetzincin